MKTPFVAQDISIRSALRLRKEKNLYKQSKRSVITPNLVAIPFSFIMALLS
jgi:hypothetical protein